MGKRVAFTRSRQQRFIGAKRLRPDDGLSALPDLVEGRSRPPDLKLAFSKPDGESLSATVSSELSDLTINETGLTPRDFVVLDVIERETTRICARRRFLFSLLRAGEGVERIVASRALKDAIQAA